MPEPVRVLHVFRLLTRGGAESMVMNLYRSADREKIQFDFVVCEGKKAAYEDEVLSLGGRIYRLPRFGPGTVIRFIRAWNDLFRKHGEYRIIHGHLRSCASIYLSIARRYGLITIIHSHSTSSGKGLLAIIKNLMQLPLRKTADYLIACSNAAGVWLYGKKAVKKDNYYIIKNALDAQSFRFDEDKRFAARHALGLGNRFVVGHVGSFIPVKNHAFIIEIFNEIRKRNSTAVLLLVGDGKLMQSTKALARKYALSDKIIFTGVREDIPELLCAMDVFLLPSKWEGLPLTAIEAQASGLPCVLSDTITRETKISPLVEFYPLGESAGAWADKILAFSGSTKRLDTYDVIRNSGYDCADTASKLQEFYFRALEKRRKQ